MNWKDHKIWVNLGVRSQTWNVKTVTEKSKFQYTFSPRAQFCYKTRLGQG